MGSMLRVYLRTGFRLIVDVYVSVLPPVITTVLLLSFYYNCSYGL